MSSAEKNLVAKILQTKELSDVLDAGISPEFFLDPGHRNHYETILYHQATYGKVPTLETFHEDDPNYEPPPAEEPLAFYIDRLQVAYKNYLFEVGVDEAISHHEGQDIERAIQALSRTLQQINSEVSQARVVDVTKTSEARLDRYRSYARKDGSLKGIPTGFNCLDQMTLGWQPGQFIVFVGPPGVGKSTMMLLSTMAAHKAIYSPLFIGFEMSNEEQEERYDTISAEVSHQKLRSGTLSKKEYQKIEKAMLRNHEMPPLIFSEDTGSTLTVSGIAAQVERYKPPVVFIDGLYMMEDDHGEKKGSPQSHTNITRGLKQMAKNMRVTVVGSTQVLLQKMDRKRGVTQASVGYSSSYLQDADVMVAIEGTEDPTIKRLKELKARNHAMVEAFLRWNWDIGKFEEFEEVEDEYDQEAHTF